MGCSICGNEFDLQQCKSCMELFCPECDILEDDMCNSCLEDDFGDTTC